MKEEEIRPSSIFKEYLRLCEKDIETFFSDAPRNKIKCPACQNEGKIEFEKHRFSYELCPECYTLFVNPRPENSTFTRYYKESESAAYWASTFYKETAEARREKIWKPKAELLYEKMKANNAMDHHVVDIGGGYGIFAEEMEKISTHPVIVIEPGPSLAEACRLKGLHVIEKFFCDVHEEDLPKAPKVFVSFELFEHLHDPGDFLNDVNKVLHKDDLFIFTTLSGQGIDILTLWEQSKSISPPHHLNFFNPQSIRILLNNAGLIPLETSTPGKLDVDLLCQHASGTHRFWDRYNNVADEKTRQQWQKVISETGWSSHMMVVCKRKENGTLADE